MFTFSEESLTDAFKREFCRPPDQALLAICKAKDRIGRVAVADPWRSAPVRLARALLAGHLPRTKLEGVALIKPLRLRRRDPTSLPALHRSYHRYDQVLERNAKKNGLHDPVVLTFNPFVAAFCPLKWASAVIFYARDDFAEGPLGKQWWSVYLQAYKAIRERGARIICVSEELAKRVAKDSSAVVISNGIDENWWREPIPAPASFARLRRPIITYVGTIEERLDTELIEQTARMGDVGSIALIGPLMDDTIASRLRIIEKVTLFGSMSRAGVVGSLMNSDVCIIPHAVTRLTRAMSPLKLYEYLAAGKPVVTTDLPPVIGVSDRILVSERADFPNAVVKALSLPVQTEDQRLKFVRENSWSTRLDRMLQVLTADDEDWWKS